MKEISWKYKSVERAKLGHVVTELFEWCNKYYVRIYGTAHNFVDISISEDLQHSKQIYDNLLALVELGTTV